MHIVMQHLHQVFFSVVLTHLLSYDLGLEKRMAGKYELFYALYVAGEWMDSANIIIEILEKESRTK